MFIHELKPAKGANRARKRLGRGTGSGLGTTAGKGHKGQKARSGGQTKPGFEGGQMPMTRRIPKRGFSNARFSTVYETVNLKSVDKYFTEGSLVNTETLKAFGLIHGDRAGVKILGDGEFNKKLSFKVHKISKTAMEKVQAAGGEVEIIPPFKEKEVVRERYLAKAAKKASKQAKPIKK
ncbi:MAG: 50S ribosomal protein L15 [Deferribacteraceae bacterium]|nr:50S ribosomal protein L15 [Deferribacteraceae bacterium]